MRKLNSIVIDQFAPEDSEVLWINPAAITYKSLGIFICEAGVWKDISETLGDVVNSSAEAVTAVGNIYATKSSVSTLSGTVANHTSAIGTLTEKTTALWEEVFPGATQSEPGEE